MTPSEVITYVGRTAEITCHNVVLEDIRELNLVNEMAVKIEKPQNKTKTSDTFDTHFVNITYVIFDIQRRDDMQSVHCVQLDRFSSSASIIQVYGE